jgi:glycosyltransferase involved in cell wall biosynthesis
MELRISMFQETTMSNVLLVLSAGNLRSAKRDEFQLAYAYGIISHLAETSNLTILVNSNDDVKRLEDFLCKRLESAVRLVVLPDTDRPGAKVQDLRLKDFRPFVNESQKIYDYLVESNFDCVIFDVFDALGFVPMRAKKTGLHFENVVLASWLRTCHKFRRDQLFEIPSNLLELRICQHLDFAERYCCETSDVVIHHTEPILRWALQQEWNIDFDKAILANEFDVDSSMKVVGGQPFVDLTQIGEISLTKANPLVSICVAHYNDGQNLTYLLESIEENDYQNFEVIVVDDGSTDANSLNIIKSLMLRYASRSWRFILKEENESIGPTRNFAVTQAHGEFIIFMDSDNLATKTMIRDFVRGMLVSGSDCLTCSMIQFTGEGPNPPESNVTGCWMPLGACIEAGLYSNVFGDANFCVKKSVFEALGGFCGARGEVADDWEFLARLVLADFSLDVVPKGIFLYRVRQGSWLQNAWSNHSIETLRKRILSNIGQRHEKLIKNLLIQTIEENQRLRRATWELDRGIVQIALKVSNIVSEDTRGFFRDLIILFLDKMEIVKSKALGLLKSKKLSVSAKPKSSPVQKSQELPISSNSNRANFLTLRKSALGFTNSERHTELLRLGLPLDRPIFGFIGELNDSNRPLGFLRLCYWAKMFHDKSFFVMIGEGALKEDIVETAIKYKLENFKFLKMPQEGPGLYLLLSGFIVTAKSDHEPAQMYEALIHGVPVFSTEVGNAKHLLEQYGTGVAAPYDPTGKDFADCWKLWKDNLGIYKTAAVETADLLISNYNAQKM